MSRDLTSPDTSIALMRAAQGQAAQAGKTVASSGGLSREEAGKIERAAEDFEALFIAEMMKPMFEGISTEAPFGGGKGEEIFRSFLLQEYGKMTARTGTIGIADQVKEHMIKIQEQATHADDTRT